MNSPARRQYTNTNREQKATQTGKAILNAMTGLWLEKDLRDITLEEVAEKAQVSVRTVIRKYGSKEGLMEACIREHAGQHLLKRHSRPVADWKDALSLLLEEYETMGDAVIRTLSIEHGNAAANSLAQHGRQEHLEWCTKTFREFLPPPAADSFRPRLLALRAATDLYVWKLLRRDLNCGPEETFGIMKNTIKALIHSYLQQPHIKP